MKEQQEVLREFLTVAQVAKQLGISPSKCYVLTDTKAIKSIRIGQSIRIRPEWVAAYLKSLGDQAA